MNAQVLALTIIRGLSRPSVLIVFKDDTGTPFDLAGWSVFSQARTSPRYRPSVDLKPSILDAATELYGTTGLGRIKMAEFTPDETSAMTKSELGFDVILQDPTGGRSGPYVVGPIKIIDINTQP